MRKQPLFCVGPIVLFCCVSFGAGVADAAPTPKTAPKKKPTQTTASRVATTAQPQSLAQKRTLYSPERSLARKATLARARANAVAREMAEVLPRYKVDASGERVPDVRAAAAIIYDPDTNEVLWEENSQSQRSIASITKVMTATVFFENNPDTSQMVTIAKSDVFQASTTYLHLNDRVTVDDLLHLLLIASDNAAARALARVSPCRIGRLRATDERKALELGLQVQLCGSSGLLWDNVVGMRRRGSSRTPRATKDYSIMQCRLHGLYRQSARAHVPQHQPPSRARRSRCQGGEDRLHLEVGLLPGDASPSTGKRPSGRRGGPRRTIECRALHGDPEPLHLVVLAGAVGVRHENGRSPHSHNSPW